MMKTMKMEKISLNEDIKKFRKEVEENYESFFQKKMPQAKISFSFMLWVIELFDKDKQFLNEFDEYLRKRRKVHGQKSIRINDRINKRKKKNKAQII